MKNKLLGILFCGILLLGLTGCNDKIDQNVILSIKEGTLTNKSVTLILKNDSKVNYSYGELYYIEQEKNGDWQKLETIHDMVFNLPAYQLESGKSVEISINWLYGYGYLESGKYRIIKQIYENNDSKLHDSNIVSFNVYAEFEINEDDYEYEKSTVTEVELKTELETMNHGNSEEELVKYKTYIKNNKLYAKDLKTNEEKMIFDKEPVKNIATRNICCAGNAYLLILTSNGNVYMSNEDINYGFTFNIKFNKLDVKNIVAFKLIPVADYDFTKNLYGVDIEGKEILLHKMN